jgi:threonine synthase
MSIWKHKEIKELFPETTNLITLDEGNTPVDDKKINGIEVYVKREDLNPTGSWKDRGSAYKIVELQEDGIKEAVLFSSGNAVISLLEYAKLFPEFKLNVVVSTNTSEIKMQKIKELMHEPHELFVVDNPKEKAIKISAEKKIPNLRVSIDNNIHKAYWSLGIELGKLLKKTSEFNDGNINKDIGLFIPTSSGTAAVGITQGLQIELGDEFQLPRIYICQTTSTHPFINEVLRLATLAQDDKGMRNEESLADAIVDKVGLRKPQMDKIVKETNGKVLVITNQYLEKAKEIYPELTYNSLLSIAGFLQQVEEGEVFTKAICVASGR